MNLNSHFSTPTDTIFTIKVAPAKIGIGATLELGFELKRRGAEKILVVTDKVISEKTDICQRLVDAVKSNGLKVDVWDGVEPEPSRHSMEEGISYAKREKYDAFVGLGGGSSIDTAKVINLYTTYPTDDFFDYIAKPTGKGKEIPGTLKPLIAVPTTSGTGSETTSVAVIDLPEYKLKVGISHEYLLPTLAIIDPLNMITMPPSVTANTGMDALMHAIEAYTCKPYNTRPKPSSPVERPVYTGSNPITDAFAEKAIELIGKYLRKAVYNGHDIKARTGMAIAAYIAGIAFGNAGVHISHAIALAIGGKKKLPHGLCASITAPALLKFLAPIMPEKLTRIAELLGENTRNLSVHEAAYKASEAVKRLMKDIGFPNGLKDLSFSENDIPELADKTLRLKRLLAQSPRTITKNLMEEVLRESLKYW